MRGIKICLLKEDISNVLNIDDFAKKSFNTLSFEKNKSQSLTKAIKEVDLVEFRKLAVKNSIRSILFGNCTIRRKLIIELKRQE